MKVVILNFVLLFLILNSVQVFSACNNYTDCTSCASSSSWLSNCRWCERDNHCHATGAVFTNPCTASENIANPKYCTCYPTNCVPSSGYGADVCSWYLSGSPDPGNDTSKWKGGDFLPAPYASAAQCACSGNGSPLWQSKAASCVRKKVLDGHQALPSDFKKGLRDATITGLCNQALPYLSTLIHLHVTAYTACCCSGTPAPYLDWYAVLCFGNLAPCSKVIDAILDSGRCGCGW